MKKSEFRHSFLKARSSSSNSVTNLVSGKFDFALFSLSWDRRSISITEATDLNAEVSALIIPKLRDSTGLMDNNERLLHNYLKRFENNSTLNIDTSDLKSLWKKFSELIFDIYKEKGRPLKIFIDLSTCVRYIALGLISSFIKSGIVKQVTVFYAEGEYPTEIKPEDKYELFTTGGWEALPVPGLEGNWDPNKKNMYLVSIGFEGTKTLRLVSREEPDKISLLIPDPGVKEEYTKRTIERNQPLINRFQIHDKNIVRASASDAVLVWENLTKASIENPEINNIFYVCCGTKPQSLALAMRSIVIGYPTLLYIKPDSHRVVEVNPLGLYWRFDLLDMSSLDFLANE